MYPTVAEALTVPVLRRGRPTVVAGHRGLSNPVRWVHIAEISDIGELLSGGELLLTTGIVLPEEPEALRSYVTGLAGAGASGLVVELLRRYPAGLPEALVSAAESAGLPLISLAAETRFVHVTEALTERIRDAQLAELRAAERVHETFTALTSSGAEPATVLHEVVRLLGKPVVLENLSHEVLAFDAAGESTAQLLADWHTRASAVTIHERTGYHEASGWLLTVVGARGDDWGRLVIPGTEQPPHREIVVLERAASALAVHRLLSRERETLERQTHRTLLTELLGRGYDADILPRAHALGVPLTERTLVGIAVHLRALPHSPAPALATQAVLRDLADTVSLAARRESIPALVAVLDDTSVRGLLSFTEHQESTLLRLARHIRRSGAGWRQPVDVLVAVGTPVTEMADAHRTLAEAEHAAAAAPRDGDRELYRLEDVRLRGLLHLLRADSRLSAFADRELGPLYARDARTGSRLVEALRHFCAHGGNKSAAAAAAHVSRTAYYQQLDRIEQVLGVSLADPESMLSLYVALLATETRESAG
ncbi:PucR family transcriptional regulator [Sciscionella sediminilitoris]|uniref:PucR family transcriptional regulator n=1 Tax=Sciscionella sediminilitoris TaxID=1445613 RepID=UPI0004DFC1C3|nr:PucR family transcriptional regulator [Sciscionella sp. SE31]